MKVKKIIIASLINGIRHPLLTEEESTINGVMPLISEMFPGINYYSISGFCQVKDDYVIPVLKKRFPDMVGVNFESLTTEDVVEIQEVLPCKGYEHQDNPEWKKKLDALLAL